MFTPQKNMPLFWSELLCPACLLELHHTFWKIDSVFHRVWESSKVSSQRSTSCYRKLWFVALKKNWANLPIINKSHWSSSCSGKQSSNQYLIQLRNLLFSFSFSIVICNEKKSRFTQYLIETKYLILIIIILSNYCVLLLLEIDKGQPVIKFQAFLSITMHQYQKWFISP